MADGAGHCSSNGSQDRRSHFLVAAYGYQGHLNPALALAHRLARGGARVTLSVSFSAHARMFPSSLGQVVSPPDAEASDGVISYVPYSDGFDGFGERPRTAVDRARRRNVSAASLSAIVRRLAAAGRPVTCVVSSLLLPAADVALEHGIPLAVFWNQSAATLAAYYHYFHGHEHLVAAAATAHVGGADEASVNLPGLPPLRVRDLPSFLVDATAVGGELAKTSADSMRALLEIVGREKPVILVNTLDDVLEPEAVALRAMRQQHMEVFAVGPMLPRLQQTDAADADTDDDEGRRIDLYEHDDEKRYMAWLDARPRRSVVYVSFGSMLGYNTQQAQEMLRGLRECRRPYLWVVPRDGCDGEVERCLMAEMDDGERGMVVEWCDQLKVLAHPSTGCFVTHCGWNSTLEALAFGVPMVAVPSWSDQPVNARLVEELGIGVRAERDADNAGLLVGTELARCIAVVTGDGAEGMRIRNRASFLRDKVRKEVIESGLTEFRLQNFISAMQNPM